MLTEQDIAELVALATRWVTARAWTSIDDYLNPPPVAPELLATLSSDPIARAAALADAADFQSAGKPFGLGLELRWDGGTLAAADGELRVHDARFVIETVDRMDPASQQLVRTPVVFRELRREAGAWRVAGLLDDATRARIASEREMLRAVRGR